MAQLIAPTPEYRSRENLPPRLRLRYADLRGAYVVGRSISNVGRALVGLGQKMKRERDAAVVADLYNNWRDNDRQKISELLQRQGKDAVNLPEEYVEYFNESSGQIDEGTENSTQQTELGNLLARRREQNLDIVARYESMERRRYRDEQHSAFVNNAVEDVRQHGFDDVALENTLIDVFDRTAAAYPGMSEEAMEALQSKQRSQILFANMQAQADENPELALKNIEGWKEQLGGGYDKLKRSLKGKIRDLNLDGAYGNLVSKYGQNFEAAITEINDPKSRVLEGLSFEERTSLNNRFRGLYNQREAQEAEQRANKNRQVAENDFNAWIRFFANDLPPEELQALGENRQISERAFIQMQTKRSKGAEENNPFVVGDIAIRMERGEDVKNDLIEAASNGHIKTSTLLSYLRANEDEQKKAGLNILTSALKPSPADKYKPDLHLRFSDAIDQYISRVAEAPEDVSPLDIARDIKDSYTEGTRRTIAGLARPKYIQGNDLDNQSLAEAHEKTLDAYFSEEIGESQFRFEMDLINKYLEYNNRVSNVPPTVQKEIDKRLKR